MECYLNMVMSIDYYSTGGNALVKANGSSSSSSSSSSSGSSSSSSCSSNRSSKTRSRFE